MARLWLRLGIGGPANRCDLLSLRRDEDGTFVFTALEVKTTLDADLPEEEQRVAAGLVQVTSTASVIRRALDDETGDVFTAPRLEMLKEVLVRAAGVRWSTEEVDVDHRRRWGPWLRDLFDPAIRPPVRVEGEVVLVKLRANRPPVRRPLPCEDLAVTLSVVTEPLARELLGITDTASARENLADAVDRDEVPLSVDVGGGEARLAGASAGTVIPPDAAPGGDEPVTAVTRAWAEEIVTASADRAETPMPEVTAPTEQQTSQQSGEADVPAARSVAADGAWPPPLNALGMIGQQEAARELAALAKKSKGWKERFPDKLLVGPAGVGKTSIAYEVAKRLLDLEPILFNGADLRRPEMVVERLRKAGMVPEVGPDEVGPITVAPCVVFVDEIHAISGSVATALLSALDERRTTTVDNVAYDFSKVVFLLATTDPGKLSEAFLSRPTRTTLRAYTLEETAGIVWLRGRGMLASADLPRDACIEIAARMQCGPRQSVKILDPLVAHFYSLAEAEADGEVPSRQSVASRMNAEDVGKWFSETMQVDANGLGPIHRDLLGILASRGAVSEDEIRRSLAISNKADFIEIGEYLTRLGLMRVGPGGRSLTRDGRRYVMEGGRMDLRDRIPRRGAG